jgi:ATP-dependent Lon protease
LPWQTRERGSISTSSAPSEMLDERPLRPREGQGADSSSTWRSRSLKGDVLGPILCFVGPPGVGQDVAGTIDRRGAGAQVRAHLVSAECATRPRSAAIAAPTSGPCPAIILRAIRDAGTDNPVFMIDEIDKMGMPTGAATPRAPCSRCSTPNRTTRSATTTSTCPSTLEGHVHHHRQPARDHPRAAARPHGDHRAGRLHDRGEAAHRAQAIWCPSRSRRNGLRPSQVTFDDAALHEIITSYTVEAGVRNLERELAARSAARLARQVAEGNGRPAAVQGREAKCASCSDGRGVFAETKRRTADAGVATGLAVDAGGRRHPLHRGHGHAGQRAPDRHRSARRRHEGVGPGGGKLRARPLRRARDAR